MSTKTIITINIYIMGLVLTIMTMTNLKKNSLVDSVALILGLKPASQSLETKASISP